jgi:hypothetical protein
MSKKSVPEGHATLFTHHRRANFHSNNQLRVQQRIVYKILASTNDDLMPLFSRTTILIFFPHRRKCVNYNPFGLGNDIENCNTWSMHDK